MTFRHCDNTAWWIGTCWYCIARSWQAAKYLWMQSIYHFGNVTSQLYCNEWWDIKRRRFTDRKLHQRDCCEELCLKFNVGRLCVDVKRKQTESHFDDIKCAGIKVIEFEREITEQEWKNHLIVKYSTRSVRVYIYICIYWAVALLPAPIKAVFRFSFPSFPARLDTSDWLPSRRI